MMPTAVGLASEATLPETTPIRVYLQLARLASRDGWFIRGSFVLSSRPFAFGIRVHSRSLFAPLREIFSSSVLLPQVSAANSYPGRRVYCRVDDQSDDARTSIHATNSGRLVSAACH